MRSKPREWELTTPPAPGSDDRLEFFLDAGGCGLAPARDPRNPTRARHSLYACRMSAHPDALTACSYGPLIATHRRAGKSHFLCQNFLGYRLIVSLAANTPVGPTLACARPRPREKPWSALRGGGGGSQSGNEATSPPFCSSPRQLMDRCSTRRVVKFPIRASMLLSRSIHNSLT
jgi:hypothetical protein